MTEYDFYRFEDGLTRRGKIFLGIILAFLLLMLAVGLAYPAPITHEDARSWIERVGDDVVADVLVRINNSEPTVMLPATIYLLDGRDLVVSHDPKSIDVSLPPYIHYTIELPDERVKNFQPRKSPWPVIMGIASAAVASILTDELLADAPFKQVEAAGVGFGTGIAVWLLWPQ